MTGPRLPDTDRLLSPYTGWTRQHWVGLADHLLDALLPWFSAGGARIDLPGRGSWSGRACDGLEGFARSFLLAAFRIAATRGEGCAAIIERYTSGLVTGADAASAEAWPRLTPCSQQMVEAAAVAIALHETRPWIFDRLDIAEQRAVVDWLGGFVGSRTWDNNWHLFQVVTEQFLASVGADHSVDEIDRGLDRIEDWYRADGWYSDGPGQNFDYYNHFVMHPYPLLWARMAQATAGTDVTERLDTYRSRLRDFLGQAVTAVGRDGRPVLQGRSLCYRMGMLAPFWAGALLDATPLTPAQTRRLCAGVARSFVEHDVPGPDCLWNLGWHQQHLALTQPYSGPGSPYWGAKGFLGLLIDADHPVWTEREQALPQDATDVQQAQPAPGWLVASTHRDQVVRLLNHGSDHLPPAAPGTIAEADDHYDRLAYSNRTSPQVPTTRPGIDNALVLVRPDGSQARRGHIRRLGVSQHAAGSEWDVEINGQLRQVRSVSVLRGAVEVRVQLVPHSPGLRVRHGGWAVSGPRRPEATAGPGQVVVVNRDGLGSWLVNRYGWQIADVVYEIGADALGVHSATPVLEADCSGEGDTVLVSAVALGGDVTWPGDAAAAVEVAVRGTRVTMTFGDRTRATVEIGAQPGAALVVCTVPGAAEEVLVL
ncbi:MAG: DUF2264 domain-containing protein [Propionibacteriales bacterium]|nr:DUF2264 domain-containing protein [Propionibacteriales bacterium]